MTQASSSTPPMTAYAALGVSPADTFATIRAAWRTLVKAHHPDLPGNDTPAATARLAEINEAWDALRHHSAAGAREALQAKRARAEAMRATTERARARSAATQSAEDAARRAAREQAAEAERHARMEEAAARAEARAAARAQADALARIERARRAAEARAALRPITEKYRAAKAVFAPAMAAQAAGPRADLCA